MSIFSRHGGIKGPGLAPDTPKLPRQDTAKCPLCGGFLRFIFGEYGQTLEKCDTRQCPNRIPHPPQPDPDAGSPRFREPGSAKRRRKEDR